MTLNAITVLLPVFFVLGLGYVAGRTHKFDADQVQGINRTPARAALQDL
jgi:predicted permease